MGLVSGKGPRQSGVKGRTACGSDLPGGGKGKKKNNVDVLFFFFFVEPAL